MAQRGGEQRAGSATYGWSSLHLLPRAETKTGPQTPAMLLQVMGFWCRGSMWHSEGRWAHIYFRFFLKEWDGGISTSSHWRTQWPALHDFIGMVE